MADDLILREDVPNIDFSDICTGERTPRITPGEMLHEEFMVPLGLSARALARDMGVPPDRITEIVRGERGITAKTAILLGKRFGNSAEFWLNLQTHYDLAVAREEMERAA